MLLLLGANSALAQTPSLEFAPLAGVNPTGNGPLIAAQAITLQNNTNNPTGNTFASFTPTTKATFSLSNQQYTAVPTISTGTGVVFGAGSNGGGSSPTVAPLFPPLNGAFNYYNDNVYTSTNKVAAGTGITQASNNGVGMFLSVEALPDNAPTTTRYQFADLTITYDHAVVNPIIQVTDLGGTGNGLGFAADLDLVAPATGVTLSKLSGSAGFAVSGAQIRNSNGSLTASTNFVSGSVLVSTPATGVTSLTFRLFVHSDAAIATWHLPGAHGSHYGDRFYMSTSASTPAPVATPATLTFENPGGTNSTAVSAGFSGTDASDGALTALTLTTFPTNATSITINGTTYAGAAAFNAASVAARTLTTNADGTLAPGQTVTIDPTDGGVTSVLPFTVTDVQGATSTAANLTVNFTATSSGYVFEDINYGGGAGRPFSTAGTSPRSGATVELYNTLTGAFVARTTTDAAGKYSFPTTANTGYTVRVVNSSVSSSRNTTATGLLAVQTYNGTTTRVGGERPDFTDALANTAGTPLATLTPLNGTTTPESLASFNTSNNNGPDFGFNFDVIVNTNDAGQGSLRQFITNSNALGGETALAQVYTPATGATTALTPGVETSIFMIPNGTAVAGQVANLTNGFSVTASGTAATILLTSAGLPDITGPFTALDGSTQTRSTGNSNAPSTTLNAESTGPEVIINLGFRAATPGPAAAGFNSVAVNANDVRLLNLGVTNSATDSEGITVRANALRTIINNNTVNNNDANITFSGSSSASVVTNNIIRNSRGGDNDGLELYGNNSNLTITGNQFLRNSAFGIDFLGGSTNNTITGNTFTGNGVFSGGQLSGIGLRNNGSSNNTIANNTFTGNKGAGIVAVGGTTNNVFSQNSFSGNGFRSDGTIATVGKGLAIDLASGTDVNGNANGDGVTINDLNDADTGANGLLNFPVLTTATVNATNLVLNGYARPGVLVELYLAAADPTNFGEGQTYLTSFTQSTVVGTTGNVVTGAAGTYPVSGNQVNGLNQGTDNTNTFTVTIPLSSLTAAQKTALQSGSAVLTSTATSTGVGTSEFSGNLALAVADVTVSLAGLTTLNAGQATGTYTATFTNEGPGAATNVARVLTLPTGASLTPAQQTTLTSAGATIGTNGSGNITLTYGTLSTLAANGTSVVMFAFTAPTAVSTSLSLAASTTADSQGANTAPDQAAITLSTVATADVTASVSAAASATTGTFTVTFGNNGPQAAAGVVPTVQLPAGLILSATPAGWSYNSATGLLTYTAGPTTLAANTASALSVTVSYPLATAPQAPVTAVASVSTTTDEAGNTANNVQSATMKPQFDLTTTLSGTAAIAGSPTTLYVTTTNNGPNTAGDATQTVTLPIGLSNLFITNGGSYDSGTGVVTFLPLTNLPGGQTVTNSISFLAPSANFAPTAAVTTTVAATLATETNTTNNTATLNVAVSAATGVALANEATTITATVGTTTTTATVVDPGSVVTYTVTSTNKGYYATPTPATPSASVTQKVQLLPGLTAGNLTVGGKAATISSTTLSFAATNGITSTYDPATGVLTYSSVTEASGATTTYPSIVVTAPATVGNGGQLVATASVSTNLQDNVPADNVASVGVRVTTKPDLVTTITGPSSTAAGLPATYVVRFANNGATDAASVTETAQLPAGLSNVVVRDASGNVLPGNPYNPTTGQVTFAATTPLATSATQLFTITLTAPGQTFPVNGTIASATADGVATNNSASLTTTVTANADLAVSVTGPATAVVGNPVTYIVTTANNGPTTATQVASFLQLPKGLTGVEIAGNATYNSSTGQLSFGTLATIVPGGSAVNYITFTMPSATATGDAAVSNGEIIASASVSSSTTDAVASNNTAALTTSVAPATTEVADLATSLSLTSPTPTGSPAGVPAGTILTYTVAYRNTAGSTATSVVGTVNLPTGLSATDLKVGDVTGTLAGNIITFPASPAGVPIGTTYNTTTGLLTFPTFATLAGNGPGSAYTISFPAPVGSGQLVVISEITSATTETTTAISPNTTVRANRSNSSITINTNYDVTTTLAGPLTAQPGTTNTYTVTSLNNGLSATSTASTQTVTLLPGVMATTISVGGTQVGNTITWSIPAGQAAGAANAVINSFSVVMPATDNLQLTAQISSAGEPATNPVTNASNTTNNSDKLVTNPSNVAPVAENVWNTLRTARSNDANTAAPYGLLISPLAALDPENSLGKYTITAVPDPSQGKLYYDGGITALASNAVITDPSKLYFAPTAGYVGNATFLYKVTDNSNGIDPTTLSSPVAIYTIPVAADQEAADYVKTSPKGGTTGAYMAGDVIAYTADPNAANYGATGVVYSTDGKTLNTNANNGIASATTGAFTSSRADVTSLTALGLSVDNQGRIVVSNAGTPASPNLRAGNYTVAITTVDANGGVTTQTVSFTIGANPLPVVLTAFSASALQNRDAQLSWSTASEENSAYFDVERSLDGVSFAKVGKVASQGTTATASTYAFTDAGVAARATGAVYYRLKQVDLDAKFVYSAVRTVSFTKAASLALSLYPNPAQNATTLDLSQLPAAGTYQVLVLDATGRQVRTASLGGGLAQTLDLHELATGTYHVLVTGTLADGSALRQTLRLTKE